jgi:hypothetical protein
MVYRKDYATLRSKQSNATMNGLPARNHYLGKKIPNANSPLLGQVANKRGKKEVILQKSGLGLGRI